MTTYTIHPNEPEGWLKAFQVRKDGVHIAYFRYLDDAQSYVNDRTPAPAPKVATVENRRRLGSLVGM